MSNPVERVIHGSQSREREEKRHRGCRHVEEKPKEADTHARADSDAESCTDFPHEGACHEIERDINGVENEKVEDDAYNVVPRFKHQYRNKYRDERACKRVEPHRYFIQPKIREMKTRPMPVIEMKSADH